MSQNDVNTITKAADLFAEIAADYINGSRKQDKILYFAAQLRDLLPKPRYFVEGRYVYDREIPSRCVARASTRDFPDDATAALIAQDIAEAYNKRLGGEGL